MTTSVSEILLNQVVRLFTDAQLKGRTAAHGIDEVLWSNAQAMGLPLAMSPEALGGSELGWSDMFDVIAHSASCGEPIPFGETVVANALLSSIGSAPADGPIVLRIPAGETTAGARPTIFALTSAPDGSRDALKLTTIEDHSAIAAADITPPETPRDDSVWLQGALLRSVQISGALQGALNLSVQYAQDRGQFGRPLSKFQAVQHMLAQLACEAAAAAAASRVACAKLDAGDNAVLAVAVAKVRVGQAAQKGAMLAHQIHGAIGVTLEYPLARLTLNMWRWCEEFGNERYWAVLLARTGLSKSSIWDAIVAASDPAEKSSHG